MKHIRGFGVSNVKNFRQFYLTYPWFGESTSAAIRHLPVIQTITDFYFGSLAWRENNRGK